MTIIRVGIGKEYTGINSALGAAEEGDIVLIDPGDYTSEGQINIYKPVHLVGDTKDITGSDQIKICRVIFGTCTAIKTTKIVFENLNISYNLLNNSAVGSTSSWDKNVEVIFNKCNMKVLSYQYEIAHWHSASKLTLINCTIYTQHLFTKYESADIHEKMSTIRTYVTLGYRFVNLVYQDYVFSPTEGYGYNYGYSYFKLPSKYYFQGTVTEEGVPVSRVVKAYRRDNDVAMGQTISDATTGSYKLITEYPDEHYLICRDDSEGEQYNDLVRSLIIPALGEYEENQWTKSEKYTLTIDHTIIDEDLYDFPVLIKLNNSCGINNFDAQDIFVKLHMEASRWSLQTDDFQQLYIELVKWDNINQEAVAWTQIPMIKSSSDTVLTLYYNPLLPNNSFQIGVSANRLTSHLWGRSCIGVWHMQEDPGNSLEVKDSTYYRHHATPYSLGTPTHINGDIGKAIDFNSGYLKINELNSKLTSDTTLFTIAKFDGINNYGTIFCSGGYGKGWEVGVDNGDLFSHVNSDTDYSRKLTTTLSGITDTYHLITAVVDNTANVSSLFIDGNKVSDRTYTQPPGSYIGEGGETIGTSYNSRPSMTPHVSGVLNYESIPITTVSGTVVSGTVFRLKNNSSTYVDETGRHTFTERRPDEITLEDELKKSAQASLKVVAGDILDDGVSTLNYVLINDNTSDFAFDGDFTISFWVYPYIYTSLAGSVSVTLYGDTYLNMSQPCLTIKAYFQFNNPDSIVGYFYVTIPSSSGFILQNELVYGGVTNGISNKFTHIALVRYNGTINFYMNGGLEYSYFSTEAIPSPASNGKLLALTAFYSSASAVKTSYVTINEFEVVKGFARWNAPFEIIPESKLSPDTFFSGQIDEIMLYNDAKTDTYIEIFNESVKDNLITYS